MEIDFYNLYILFIQSSFVSFLVGVYWFVKTPEKERTQRVRLSLILPALLTTILTCFYYRATFDLNNGMINGIFAGTIGITGVLLLYLLISKWRLHQKTMDEYLS